MKERITLSSVYLGALCAALLGCTSTHAELTSLSKADPYPLFTSLDPHEFVATAEKLRLKGDPFGDNKKDFATISISPFGQNATRGANAQGQKMIGDRVVQLGDIPERTNMIPLLFGEIPAGQTLPPLLLNAMTNLFPGVTPGTLEDGTFIDPNQTFGFFTFPVKYRKRGLRFQFDMNLLAGFGLQFETGVASVNQTVTAYTDLTGCGETECPFTPQPLTKDTVRAYLTNQLDEITEELGIDINSVCETSVEEVRLELFWRTPYELFPCSSDWQYIIFTPFLMLGGSISPGHEMNQNAYFDLGFGNNGHTALGFAAGFDFDFSDTMELGAEVGLTHFFARNYETLRIPTSEYQTGFYPFATSAKVQPGMNWYFAAKIATYHFVECLSFYFQFVMIEHKEDKICLCNPDPAFLPEVLEERSCFKSKFANIGFNYDVSENVGLGFVWQAPLSQQNSYRSTSVVLSIYASF